MFKQLNLLKYYYRRGKHRRQHINIKQNLKDLTKARIFEKQINQHRQQFESEPPKLTFSQTLKQQKPKLDQKFQVNRDDLQKKIRKQIKRQLKIQRIVPIQEDETFQTLQSKSHIYDQKAQIQFQQKFRKQLFKKKQTNRLIQKEKNDYRNYLQQPKNPQLIQYQQNLKRFKNSKIDSMMNFKRNNQQLRLLIDSGYIDNPHNIGIILDKMNAAPRLQHQTTQQFKPQKKQLQINRIQPQQPKQITMKQKQNTLINPQVKQIHQKMLQNTQGPTQLRSPQMLQQFFENLKQTNQIYKQKARQDLQIMKKIKQFQTTTFQNRYNTINFRFKGQVDFNWMKQTQLLSYIKTQKNVNTQPLGLLTMYAQNKDRQNKFNQPIITPTVMSRIYSVCSLHNFPQTDENNRINMLNDKKYVDLQKNLFKNIHQINDQNFADAVFAYCRNHKQQQGLLKPKMNQKIIETIWKQLNERVHSMQEQDLGLVIRSIINTPILTRQNLDWSNLIQSLSERLSIMQKDYQFESVISFLTLIPVNESSIQVVSQNMRKYKNYKWQGKQTLQSFMQCCSYLIRYKDKFSPQKAYKIIQQLKYLFCNKYQQVMSLTQQLSINTMPQLLSIIYFFQKSKQAQAKYQIQVPNKLINKCKKEIVDNIRMQKELISKTTVGNVTISMALIDYCKALSVQSSNRQNQLPVLQVSLQKSLFNFRPIPFNSINYFTYHEMTKLVNSQIANLPVKSIAQSLFAASLVRYKNQGIYQQIMQRTVQKIYYEIKQSGQQQKLSHLRYTKQYILLICTFHHSRMINKYYYHFIQILMENNVNSLVNQQPNLLIRFFQTIVSLSFTTDLRYIDDYHITHHFAKVFDICFEENLKDMVKLLKKQQLIVLEYITWIFHFFKAKQFQIKDQQKFNSNFNQKCTLLSSQLQKYTNKFSIQDQYLRSMTNLVRKMIEYTQKNSQNQKQQKLLFSQNFQSIESQYYKHSIQSIMDQQQHIGSQFKYETIYENIRKKLIKENSHQQIKPKIWRIQKPNINQVFFLVTYEHLYAKYEDKDNTTVRLFGFWKVYSEIYALKQWKFNFICTFLEG